MSLDYNEQRFRSKINTALGQVRTILENNRTPEVPSEVPHSYNDKYLLAEFLGNTTFAGLINCLELMGLDRENFIDLRKWAKNRTVTLRFSSEEKCTFDRKKERKVESKSEFVTEVERASGTTKISTKSVTTVIDYFWKFEVDYELFAYQGNNMKKKTVLQTRHASYEIVTSSENQPKPKVSIIDPIDVSLTYLLQKLTKDMQLKFNIDRSKKTCHTPRRNEDIEKTFSFLTEWCIWCNSIESYFKNRLFPVQSNHGLDLSIINSNEIFVPVIAIFENHENGDKKISEIPSPSLLFTISKPEITGNENENKPPSTLYLSDLNLFLKEQIRTFHAKIEKLEKTFPKDQFLITIQESKFLVVVSHSQRIIENFGDGINYIEEMLRNQLISAIGKVVTPVDFANYMIYHNRKIFKENYQPRKFCYAIRRPDHYPEGIISIDSNLSDGSIAEPISTIVSHKKSIQSPMKFNISAAATCCFYGDRFIHSWMGHQFSGDSGAHFNLSARARQFSSFILLIGNVISSDLFDPKYGIIIQNKDDLLIPLLFEQIPTPKAFRDAIESLSPEQQDFAKAFRSMQLESTMFGICVIQIKPQLEKLLNIPDDSLTKQIQLTQDLLELFIKYQIPSDLLSFDPQDHPNADTSDKINIVKQQVKTMFSMIDRAKNKELEEAKLKTKYDVPLISEDKLEVSYPKKKYKKKADFKMMKKRKCAAPSKPMARMSKASAPAPAPTPSSASISQQSVPPPEAPQQPAEPSTPVDEPKDDKQSSNEFESFSSEECDFDVTKLPAILDKKFEEFDDDNSLHSTIIKTSTPWNKKYQAALLAKPTQTTLSVEDLRKERNSTFDLLDAITRSGGLAIDAAEFHVVLASTHCFDKTLMDTIIKDNMNPIEKLERSTLIVATTIHQTSAAELLSDDHVDRIKEFSPALFADDASSEN